MNRRIYTPFLLYRFCEHFTPFTVRLANTIGDAGVKHLVDMLKVNTTLNSLDLSGEFCFFSYFWSVFQFMSLIYWMTLYCCHLDNQIGNGGVRDIAEVLKVNSTLVAITLSGGNIVFVCFSFTSHPFVIRNCNKQRCCRLYYRRVESERNVDFHVSDWRVWWVMTQMLFIF